jgi:IS605 OrfB family transposase
MDSMKQTKGKRCRRCCFRHIEKRKANLVDRLHWDFINDLLKDNDVIYLGDIKSHDIVRDGKNKYINREFNDLKFYKLKERFIYKASLLKKRVFFVLEHHTTKTCSGCGKLNQNAGRDVNASKNIKMKGCFQ